MSEPMNEKDAQVLEHVVASGDAETVKAESARRTRRSFVVGGVVAAAGYGVAHWINNSTPVGQLQNGLRETLNANAAINRTVFDERGLAPTYPLSRARPLRLNGVVGLEKTLMAAGWRLQVAGVANAEGSPHYAKDVTAWEYGYGGDVPPTAASNDVKSAPGNGRESKTGAPKEQKSEGQGTAAKVGGQPQAGKNAEPPVNGPAVLPQTGAPQTGAPQQANTLNPGGATDSAAGAAMAARFEAMARGLSHKRNEGNAEAGPSASGLDVGTPGLLLRMDDLLKLPKVELITEFKCVEGWSEITQWAGVRLRDFIEAYPPAKVNGREPRYVYMETPDGDYYCGYDMAAARHPQSLLVTEMSGQALTQEHGAPLRLHMPIKYGYKQIKRIGLIAYTDSKPDDFWTKLGYDWYAGL